MADQRTPNFEIPSEMRDFAEKSVEQARKAVDSFMGAAQRAVDTLEGSANSMQASATEATRKSLSYAEQNLTAAFEHAQRLVRARDVQEAMQLQSEYVRQQVASMQSQAKEFGNIAQSAVKTATSQAQSAASQAASTAQQSVSNFNQG